MNKDQTKEAIKVMQAWVDGKAIQFRTDDNANWHDLCVEFLWNWGVCDYRIKPEVFRYRVALMRHTIQDRPYYACICETEKQCQDIEGTAHFVRWIDTDWQEETV